MQESHIKANPPLIPDLNMHFQQPEQKDKVEGSKSTARTSPEFSQQDFQNVSGSQGQASGDNSDESQRSLHMVQLPQQTNNIIHQFNATNLNVFTGTSQPLVIVSSGPTPTQSQT